MPTVGLMLLAAGASTRMGTAKQLLPFRGRSLLRYMVEEAAASCCEPMVVVLGAHADRIKLAIDTITTIKNHTVENPTVKPQTVKPQTVENPRWADGMGTSIHAGMTALLTLNPMLEAVVIALCDQPFVDARLLNQLVASYRVTQRPIVASAYANSLGVPALFDRSLFPKLMSLKANTGAKALIMQHAENVEQIPFPKGVIDLDTPAQYQQLLQDVCS